MAVLTSNERVQRLEKMGLHALRSRSFAKAEAIFRDQIAVLKDFRYTDEVALAIAINNLGLSMELQGKNRFDVPAAPRASLKIVAETLPLPGVAHVAV